MSDSESRSDEDSQVESVEGSGEFSSSESDETEEVVEAKTNEIDVGGCKGADVSLTIHEQLDFTKLQQIKDIFFTNRGPDKEPELDMNQFSTALRTVLQDMDDMSDEDLAVLFMKIDANGSGQVDWDEFTGFLLQLDEGNRNMAAAAHMVDLRPLPTRAPNKCSGVTAMQHKGMIEKVINIERPGVSSYVTCGGDGTIRFWHKGSLAHFRSINHLDTIKANCEAFLKVAKGRDAEGVTRSMSSAPARRAVNAMKSAWVYDIQQMPLSNRIAAACLDRTVSFYDMLTGEFVCRITGLRSIPTCIDCLQVGPNEQLVLFGDVDGVLHLWKFGRHFHIPGPLDPREAAELQGNHSVHVHADAVSCLAYVPDLNAAVTCGMDGKVHFVDLFKRRVLRTFDGHGDRAVFAFGYCQKHRFVASAGMGREVVFWNPYTMAVLARGNGHASSVKHCLVDERSGRIITVSTDKTVRCWDCGTLRCIQSFKDGRTHRPEDTITAALWDDSRSSLVLAGSAMGVWKNMGAIQVSTRSHEVPVTSALYNRHFHQVVSGDVMGNVHVWLVETGQVAFRFSGAHETSKISCMCFDASERRLLTGANDGSVKMWNFSNGKVLQEFGRSAKPSRHVGDSNEVSGVVYCKDNRGSDQSGIDYVVTCSWDKHIRVFNVGDEADRTIHDPHGDGRGEEKAPSRIFPDDRRLRLAQEAQERRGAAGEKGADSSEVHTADILAIVHCGNQQVATGGFDGNIFLWSSDTGKVRFSMRPADHDISEELDGVSSIGGLTSVATLMDRQRKQGLVTGDGDSVNSGGYVGRMEDLLVDDDSAAAKPYWDGREFFAEQRLGGSDDGSGTAAAAEISGNGGEASVDEAEAVTSPVAGKKKAVTDIDDRAAPDSTKNDIEPREPLANPEVLTKHFPENDNDHQYHHHPDPSSGIDCSPATSLVSQLVAPRRGPGSVEEQVAEEDGGLDKDNQTGGKPRRREEGKGERDGGDKGGLEGTKGADVAATKDSPGLKSDHLQKGEKEADSAVKRLENAASNTVDCLLYIKCHGVLVSATASGALHFWDGTTGILIFCMAAQHPNNAGISALGSSEEGTVGVASGGGINIGAAAAAAAVMDKLALYTACEEGFVKTWKIGDITEHLYQTGTRTRPKPERKTRMVKGTRAQTPVVAPGNLDPTSKVGIGQKGLLFPVRQWHAHETRVSSVYGANYRGQADLLVTAGIDCYVHLWTVAGAHIGTFGQPKGAWSLGSRATWLESVDQALLNARVSDSEEEAEEDDRFGRSVGQESRANERARNQRVRRMESRNGVGSAASGGKGGGGDGPKARRNRRQEEGRSKVDRERDLVKDREETQRLQEKRYYAASQNRVQRKLLRGRLGAFCMSKDYDKKDQLQEASNILEETANKNALHPPGSCGRPGMSKHRITSILRNTYNQVSFQLRLHQHEDVHGKAEGTMARCKSRRRTKSTHSHHGGGQIRSGATTATTLSNPADALPTLTIFPESRDSIDSDGHALFNGGTLRHPLQLTTARTPHGPTVDGFPEATAGGRGSTQYTSRSNAGECCGRGSVGVHAGGADSGQVMNVGEGKLSPALRSPGETQGGKDAGWGILRPAAPTRPPGAARAGSRSGSGCGGRRIRRSSAGGVSDSGEAPGDYGVGFAPIAGS